jgi:hypothetical protein
MTESEKREQRVRLGVEVEEASENFAHERERARRLANDLEAWSRWLRHHAEKQPSASDFSPTQSDAEMRLLVDEKRKECLNFTTLLQTEENLRSARQNVSNLELRRMQLTSPPGMTVKL